MFYLVVAVYFLVKTLLALLLSITTFCYVGAQDNESFEVFFDKFMEEEFQVSRVLFPITKVFLDDDTYDADSIILQKGDWIYDRMLLSVQDKTDAYPQIYDNFSHKLRDTDERVFAWKGFSDVEVYYYFKRIAGKWFLVRIEDFSV